MLEDTWRVFFLAIRTTSFEYNKSMQEPETYLGDLLLGSIAAAPAAMYGANAGREFGQSLKDTNFNEVDSILDKQTRNEKLKKLLRPDALIEELQNNPMGPHATMTEPPIVRVSP